MRYFVFAFCSLAVPFFCFRSAIFVPIFFCDFSNLFLGSATYCALKCLPVIYFASIICESLSVLSLLPCWLFLRFNFLSFRVAMFDRIRLVSLNARGISNVEKRRTIYTWCCRRKAEFFFPAEHL